MANLLLSLLVAQVVILLVLRSVILWYFGISRIIEHLSSIDESLRTLPSVEKYDALYGRKPPRAA